jgi:hypothetical protein
VTGAGRDTSKEVAVDIGYFWQPIDTCPRGVKVQLLGQGGVAAYGNFNGHDDFWVGWAPLPSKPDWMKK